ncbi:hypothetical protein [Nocardioides sp. LHG3406-4]|uniref:hypothetical protein n=1 Tax=Nocardioides sp. LHG3406-4 TaxID=2804575 RepID=UPI003CEBC159
MAAPDPARDDPFFAELRRKHPDVDIVLLPPVDPAPPDLPPATIGQALATRRHALAVVEALWGRIDRTLESPVQFWWPQADPRLQRYVVMAAIADLEEGETEAVTNRIARALLDLGWQPQPSPADQPALLARVGSLDVKVTGHDSAVAVEIVSDPLHLTPETMSRLAEAS